MLQITSGIINKLCHSYAGEFSYDFVGDTQSVLSANKQTSEARRQFKSDLKIFGNWQIAAVRSKFAIPFLYYFVIFNFCHSARLNKSLHMICYGFVRGTLFLFIRNSRFYMVSDENKKVFGVVSYYTDGSILHWAQGLARDKRNLSSLSIYFAIAIALRMNIKSISLGPTNDETKRRRGFAKTKIDVLRNMKEFVRIPFDVRVRRGEGNLDDVFELVALD